MLNIGKMRYRMTIQERSVLTDSYGNQKNNWSDVGTVWAGIAPASGRKGFTNQQDAAEVSHRIYIRFKAGVNAKMRGICEGVTYNFVSVLADKPHDMMTIMAMEEY